MAKRTLSENEIKSLASGKNVRAIAVENFLGSLPPHTTREEDNANLWYDTKLYSWNVATQKAIREGLNLAFGSK